MTNPSGRWSEVGDKLDALGLKLKLHFEQSGDSTEVPDALQKMKKAVTEAVDAAGNAVRDDAVKDDVKEAGRLFVEALSESLAKVSESMKSSSRPAATAPDPTPAGPTPIGPTPIDATPSDPTPAAKAPEK